MSGIGVSKGSLDREISEEEKKQLCELTRNNSLFLGDYKAVVCELQECKEERSKKAARKMNYFLKKMENCLIALQRIKEDDGDISINYLFQFVLSKPSLDRSRKKIQEIYKKFIENNASTTCSANTSCSTSEDVK